MQEQLEHTVTQNIKKLCQPLGRHRVWIQKSVAEQCFHDVPTRAVVPVTAVQNIWPNQAQGIGVDAVSGVEVILGEPPETHTPALGEIACETQASGCIQDPPIESGWFSRTNQKRNTYTPPYC